MGYRLSLDKFCGYKFGVKSSQLGIKKKLKKKKNWEKKFERFFFFFSNSLPSYAAMNPVCLGECSEVL